MVRPQPGQFVCSLGSSNATGAVGDMPKIREWGAWPGSIVKPAAIAAANAGFATSFSAAGAGVATTVAFGSGEGIGFGAG